MAWYEQYPVPSAPAEQNDAAREREDGFLARFADLGALDRNQVAELVEWKFQAMPHRRALAMRGITPERWDTRDGATGAADLIRTALAANGDYEALATMAHGAGGIYRFGPAMSSVVLAACRPDRFTVADSRALRTLRGLGMMPPGPPPLPRCLPDTGRAMRPQPAPSGPIPLDRRGRYALIQ
jgi:hypothetical protein